MTEELQKQWAKDVDDYGDSAYLMWEISVNNTSEFYGMFCNSYLNELFIHNKPGSFVYESLWKGTEVKRKESAALPFNLSRAKAGDAVEWLNNDGKWELVPQNNLVYLHGQDARMRMKFPPKISTEETKITEKNK